MALFYSVGHLINSVGHYPNTALLNPPKNSFLFTSPCQGSDLSSLGRLIMKKRLDDDACHGGKFCRGAAQ